MKYRTKVTIALLSAIFFSVLIATSILYLDTKKNVYKELQSKAISVIATTSVFINLDAIESFRENPTEDNPSYQELRTTLLDVLLANKRKDLNASILYIFTKPVNQPNYITIEIDSKSVEQRNLAGHTLVRNQKFLDEKDFVQFGNFYVTENFYKNIFGTWLSAYGPIKNKEDQIIAYIGINIRSTNILMYLRKILLYCSIVFFISIIFALVVSWVLAKKCSMPLYSLCHSVEEIGSGNLDARCSYTVDDEFGDLSHEIDKMADGLEERERVKSIFTRYVSKDVLEKILEGSKSAKLEGERKKITVLFSDLRQFSKIAENTPPEKVVHILNEYLEKMIDIIFQNKGTLDKILGDGLLVLFGAPLDDENQEKRAVQAALQMQEEVQKLNHSWVGKDYPLLKMGIGIHSGDAIVGNIGSEKHLEYTAIGLCVNFAYRLEKETKKYGVPILLSETVVDKLQDIPLREWGIFSLKEGEPGLKIYGIENG